MSSMRYSRMSYAVKHQRGMPEGRCFCPYCGMLLFEFDVNDSFNITTKCHRPKCRHFITLKR